ncbi:MAG: hypothetical protein NTX87_08800 [Planctomycetota bacterium]|nr:hypothetical protein [Planctomycetota bacterium]
MKTACVAIALLALLAAGCQRPEQARPPAPAAARPSPPVPAAARPSAPTPAAARPGGERLANHASRRNNGSAAVLRGRVLLYHIWAEDAGSSWTAAGQAEVRDRVRAAIGFLNHWAGVHGVDLAFIEETAGRARSGSEIPTDMFADPVWTQRLIESAGAGDGNRFVADLKQRHQADGVLFVIHVNKAASSYHLSFYDGMHPIYAAERIVCFSSYPDRTPTCAASYAHEILHAFGAGELYFPFDRTDERATLAKGLFPNDIMCRVDRTIAALNIGPFTAYRIGWTDRLDASLASLEDVPASPPR